MTTIVNINGGVQCDVYCGRKRGTQHYGNPFVITTKQSREDVVRMHDEWLDGKHPTVEPVRRLWVLAHLEELRNKRLGCFCAPLLCHCSNYVRRLTEIKG